MLGLSGWGVSLEDNEQSINDVLDRKCSFWRICPNVSIIVGNMMTFEA